MTHSSAGMFLVHKPVGLTSHTVVSKIKRHFKFEKVGHLGTLDPFASGLLPILVEGATRLADDLMAGEKGYEFTVLLGSETNTLDCTGHVVDEKPVPKNFLVDLKSQISQFVGEIEQIPPAYSAIKMDGRPLYEYMRAHGSLPRDISEKKRSITIHELELLHGAEIGEQCFATFRVRCSKGTYVRTLASDLAKSIGTVGTCSQLSRTFVAPWELSQAVLLDDLLVLDKEKALRSLIPPESMIHWPSFEIPEGENYSLLNGNRWKLNDETIAQLRTLGANFDNRKFFVKQRETMFVGEIIEVNGDFFLQPRKRIC